MRNFFRENYRLLVVALIAILAGVAIGLAIGFGAKGDKDAASSATVIGAATRMERVMLFNACTHEKNVAMDNAAYVGYTRDELAAHFPDASIVVFNDAEVRLLQVNTGYCPNHYILRLRDDGTLGVTQTDSAYFTEELVTLIPEEHAQLLPTERKSLEAGLPFDSLSEIDTYLESMGS